MSADILTPEEAIKTNAKCLCLVLDSEIIDGLFRLRDVLGLPVGAVLSKALIPFVDNLLPLAVLCEQGNLNPETLLLNMPNMDSMLTRVEVDKAQLNRKMRMLIQHHKIKHRWHK